MFVTEEDFKVECGGDGSKRAVEYLPFDGGRMLAAAASLNGGNVLSAFVRTLQVSRILKPFISIVESLPEDL